MGKLELNSTVELYNGVKMPLFGYSTEEYAYNFQTQVEILSDAIELGFRYFDIKDEHEALRSLYKAIKISGIPRADFFVAVKMRTAELRSRFPVETFNEDLQQFGREQGDDAYFDLYSIPWPLFFRFSDAWSGKDYRKEENGYPFPFQYFYEKKMTRAIGVCNFESHHLEELFAAPKFEIVPMVNQSHFHPLYTSQPLRDYCAKHKIIFGGLFEDNGLVAPTKPTFFTDTWSSGEVFEVDERSKLANKSTIHVRRHTEPDGVYIQDPVKHHLNPRTPHYYYDDFAPITLIAKKHGKSNLQIITRWSLQHGVITLAKTIWRQKMEEYVNIFDFELDLEDMTRIDAMNADFRIGYNPDYIDF